MSERPEKSIVTAYLLWLVIGVAGAHRIYLRSYGKAIAMVVLGAAGCVIFYFGFTTSQDELKWAGLGMVGVWIAWWLMDALMMPGLVEGANAKPESEQISMAHRDLDLDPSPLAFQRKYGIKPRTDKPRGIPEGYVLPWRRDGAKPAPHPYDDVPDDDEPAGWLDDKDKKPEGKD